MKIPFNRPYLIGTELENIREAIEDNGQLSGNGPFTKACSQWLEDKLGCARALLTHSCTAALEMIALLCDIKSGDEIIMPSFTFVSTANAFVQYGATPVFVDIRPDTLNIDETLIEAAITEKTKAIVAVHYAGNPCDMDTITNLAQKYELLVIEDAAQALLSSYKGKKLGSIGDFGVLSFHETKNIISGEGGALLINNRSFSERAETIWEKGTNRKAFAEGAVDKYTWVDIGSSFLPSELSAAFLKSQLDCSETIIARRRTIFLNYLSALKKLQDFGAVKLPQLNNINEINGHIFYITVESRIIRDKLLDYLRNKGILALFHYVPLHSSPAGKRYGRSATPNLSVTDDASERLIRLPLFYELSNDEIAYIVESLYAFWD